MRPPPTYPPLYQTGPRVLMTGAMPPPAVPQQPPPDPSALSPAEPVDAAPKPKKSIRLSNKDNTHNYKPTDITTSISTFLGEFPELGAHDRKVMLTRSVGSGPYEAVVTAGAFDVLMQAESVSIFSIADEVDDMDFLVIEIDPFGRPVVPEAYGAPDVTRRAAAQAEARQRFAEKRSSDRALTQRIFYDFPAGYLLDDGEARESATSSMLAHFKNVLNAVGASSTIACDEHDKPTNTTVIFYKFPTVQARQQAMSTYRTKYTDPDPALEPVRVRLAKADRTLIGVKACCFNPACQGPPACEQRARYLERMKVLTRRPRGPLFDAADVRPDKAEKQQRTVQRQDDAVSAAEEAMRRRAAVRERKECARWKAGWCNRSDPCPFGSHRFYGGEPPVCKSANDANHICYLDPCPYMGHTARSE